MMTIRKFQKAVAMVLSMTMAVVLVLAFVDLVWAIVANIVSPPILLLEIEELLDIFGLFLLVLIGVELLETVARTSLKEEAIHVEPVLLIAIIAVSRKLIVMDLASYAPLTLVGLGAIILALSAGYFLLKSGDRGPEGR